MVVWPVVPLIRTEIMVVDFPEALNRVKSVTKLFFTQQVRDSSTFLPEVRQNPCLEGDTYSIVRPDGSEVVRTFLQFSSQFELPQAENNSSIAKLIENATLPAARDVAGQIDGSFLRFISGEAQAVGNVITGTLENPGESIIKALQGIQIEFDDDDRSKPMLPTISLHPNTYRPFLEKWVALSESEKLAFEERFEQVMCAKYDEHIKNMESRKLTD